MAANAGPLYALNHYEGLPEFRDINIEAAGDIPVFEIGDCVRAAKVGEAVQEGYTAALSIV